MIDLVLSIHGPWILQSASPENILQKFPDTIVLDGSRMINANSFYDEFSTAFEFPPYFGRNYNALRDCLTDLSWKKRDRYVVLIRAGHLILFDEKDDALIGFLETMTDVGREWSEPISIGALWDRPAIPFHTVVDSQFAQKNAIISKLAYLDM